MSTQTHGNPPLGMLTAMDIQPSGCSPLRAPKAMNTQTHGSTPLGMLTLVGIQPSGCSPLRAPKPMNTQIHGNPSLGMLTLMGTHSYRCSPPWAPKPMGIQPLHPPSRTTTSAAPIPVGIPHHGSSPCAPTPRTPTSVSPHLTNTHAHTSPGALRGKPPLQQAPSPASTHLARGYPPHRAPSPAPTHPPGPSDFGAAGSLLRFTRPPGCRRPVAGSAVASPRRRSSSSRTYKAKAAE